MFGNEMIDEASRKMAEQLSLRGLAAGMQRVKTLEEFVGDKPRPTAGDEPRPTVGDKPRPTAGDELRPTE
jgi:hypothetical protein